MIIEELIPLIPTIVDSIVTTLIEGTESLVQGGLTLLMGIIQALPTFITALVAQLPTIITTIVTTLVSNVSAIMQAGITLLSALIDAIPTIITELVANLPTIITNIVTTLISLTPTLLAEAVDLFNTLVEGLAQAGVEIVSALPEIVDSVISGLIDPLVEDFTSFIETVKGIFDGIDTWFGNLFSSAWTNITSAFSEFSSFFTGLWDTISSAFTDLGTSISDAISSAVKSGVNGIISSIESVINSGISLINGAIDLINLLPGVNCGYVSSLSLPRLAKGGIVDTPTLAEIGEQGREAIIPLENNTGWIKELANELGSELTTTNVNLNSTEAVRDTLTYDTIVEAFKDALSQVKVELDGDEMGTFIDATVTNAIYA